jgi:hypothetical protein
MDLVDAGPDLAPGSPIRLVDGSALATKASNPRTPAT